MRFKIDYVDNDADNDADLDGPMMREIVVTLSTKQRATVERVRRVEGEASALLVGQAFAMSLACQAIGHSWQHTAPPQAIVLS
jgi:hypothetical protein